jgi:hypothetical protein
VRAGLATAKLGGTVRSGSLVVIRTTTLPATCVTSRASMLLVAVPLACCAAATPMPESQSARA